MLSTCLKNGRSTRRCMLLLVLWSCVCVLGFLAVILYGNYGSSFERNIRKLTGMQTHRLPTRSKRPTALSRTTGAITTADRRTERNYTLPNNARKVTTIQTTPTRRSAVTSFVQHQFTNTTRKNIANKVTNIQTTPTRRSAVTSFVQQHQFTNTTRKNIANKITNIQTTPTRQSAVTSFVQQHQFTNTTRKNIANKVTNIQTTPTRQSAVTSFVQQHQFTNTTRKNIANKVTNIQTTPTRQSAVTSFVQKHQFSNITKTTFINKPWNCSGCFQWDFRVLINQEHVCRTHNNMSVDMVFLVPTIPKNRDRRDALRQTWGSVTRNNTSNFRQVFIFGNTDTKSMRKLEEESRHFRDIVVLNFQDTYRNLTYKTMTLLRWLTEYCTEARFFLKVDDDMWVNVKALMEQLAKVEHKLQNSIGGACKLSHRVIRNHRNKWSATWKEYPADRYPSYCSGTAYAGTVHVARQIVAVSRNVPFFHLEDVYVGLCLLQLGLPVVHIGGFHIGWSPAVRADVCGAWKPSEITVHRVSPKQQYNFWNAACGNHTA